MFFVSNPSIRLQFAYVCMAGHMYVWLGICVQGCMAGRIYVWLGICMYMTEHMYVCMAKHIYEYMAEHCVSFYELLLQHLVEANSSLVQSIR